MYSGFNLTLDSEGVFITEEIDEKLYSVGKSLLEKNSQVVKKKLENYLLENKELDGSALQSDWFPQTDLDVFISHSHQDERLAIIFTGFLHFGFKLNAFVDSSLWGYSEELLKEIDNKYCFNPSNETYDYSMRNKSTSHVHMMLSTALTKMMDNTESLFFLNTINSTVSTQKAMSQTETYSPWIYHEIATSKMLRLKYPRNIRELRKSYETGGKLMESANEDLKIRHNLDIKHLIKLDRIQLVRWWQESQEIRNKSIHPLDLLYFITNYQVNLYE